jgi:hypothetical protein
MYKGIASISFWYCIIGIVFNVCDVSFIVCATLCAVLFERAVLLCVTCVFLCVVPYCSKTARGKNPFAVQFHSNEALCHEEVCVCDSDS